MTNPTNKYTKEQFIQKFEKINGQIGLTLQIDEYKGVDYPIDVTCSHGSRRILGWQLIKKRKYCCSKGYHKKRIPSRKKTVEQRIKQFTGIFENVDYEHKLDFQNLKIDNDNLSEVPKFIVNCKIHGDFSQWSNSLLKGIGCPECSRERNRPLKRKRALNNLHKNKGVKGNWVSKAETKWLDELGVEDRQVWLNDVKYKVDGYDEETNTVYLYHGRFWHGCPKTYDPEEIHPILKCTMGSLFKKTKKWENKIIAAGYNLVVEWG